MARLLMLVAAAWMARRLPSPLRRPLDRWSAGWARRRLRHRLRGMSAVSR